MPYFNETSQELICKLVYWGPWLAGKSMHLRWLQANAPEASCGRLVQLATETESTLMFEFLPLTLATYGDTSVRFHLYTVPGQVAYPLTRRGILRGSDGVVVVADARPDRQGDNAAALRELHEALALQGQQLATFPHVLAYNYADAADALATPALEAAFNAHAAQAFPCVLPAGSGVRETLLAAATSVLRNLAGQDAPLF